MNTARRFDIPSVVWMGKVKGEWPLYAWSRQDRAAEWAEDEPLRRIIWSVLVPDDTVIYVVEAVPATYKLNQVAP